MEVRDKIEVEVRDHVVVSTPRRDLRSMTNAIV